MSADLWSALRAGGILPAAFDKMISYGQKISAMKMISISDFKSHAVQVIEHIVDTHEELLITKHGKPYQENSSKSRPGRLSKYFISETNIISPSFSEDWEALKGSGK